MVRVCSSLLQTSRQIAGCMGISFALIETDPKLVLIFFFWWWRTVSNRLHSYLFLLYIFGMLHVLLLLHTSYVLAGLVYISKSSCWCLAMTSRIMSSYFIAHILPPFPLIQFSPCLHHCSTLISSITFITTINITVATYFCVPEHHIHINCHCCEHIFQKWLIIWVGSGILVSFG
jgi:hypothetical protein